MLEIRRYESSLREDWDGLVERSRQGTFLLARGYMDYHSDRFSDMSLMFYEGGTPMALLPANVDGDGLHSHQGLTYGGLVFDERLTSGAALGLFREMNAYLGSMGIRSVTYKRIPWIYHRLPAEEDLYAIWRECSASLVGRDISTAIPMDSRLGWSRDRRYGVNKARRNGVAVGESDDIGAFWRVLEDNLRDKYGARPVHTAGEMELLRSRFPGRIRLYAATRDGRTLGGTVLYDCGRVVHAQYISASPEGKALRVIDAVIDFVLGHAMGGGGWLDFGKSTEEGGRILNEGLIYQKEGFGGRGICYDTYRWETK